MILAVIDILNWHVSPLYSLSSLLPFPEIKNFIFFPFPFPFSFFLRVELLHKQVCY
jgi:hypothetical protein